MKDFCNQMILCNYEYRTKTIVAFILFSYLLISPVFAVAGEIIEGNFTCSPKLNRFVAMKEGQLIDGPLENIKNNQISIQYILSPVQGMDAAWVFILTLNSEEFERRMIITVSNNNISRLSLKMDRELIVREYENSHSRLDLSEDMIKFVGRNMVITMRRYYKSDWDGLSIEFNAIETVYNHTIGLNCRNNIDRIDQIIDTILGTYE